jgi:outer membrane protein
VNLVLISRYFFGWLMLFASACASADNLSHAQRLLEGNQHQQAYDYLKSVETESIGDPSFDRLLAQAAAGVGAYGEATLALERLLQLDPAAVDMRVELAKNYAALGNQEQAKFQLDRAIGGTTITGLVQQARTELAVVEEKLAKRRKRPTFDPSVLSRVQVAQRPRDTHVKQPSTPPQASDANIRAPIEHAQALLRAGQALAAYETLMKIEYEGAGDLEFDYLLGIAALDAGKPDKATLALERVLAADPNYAGARIDMGRAFMALGDTTGAEAEFAAVLALNPPDPVRIRVEQFVAEMARRSSVPKTKWSGFFGISVGRDTNVNNAPGNAEQFIPGFPNGVVVLDAESVRTPSNFTLLAGRIQVDHRIDSRIGVYAGLDLNLRRNFQSSHFDSSGGEFKVGSTITLSDHEFELSLGIGKTYLDALASRDESTLGHPLYRNVVGGTAQWRFNVNEQNQLQTIIQHNRLRYPGEVTSMFDSDQTVLGVNWFRAFGANNRGLGFFGAYGGRESDIRENPSGEKDFYGVRVGGQYGLTSNLTVFAAIGLMAADYHRFQAIHQKIRDDKRYDLSLGMSYSLWADWLLRPNVSLTRQTSNIGLYEFDRMEFSVTLRRDWR